VTRPGGRLLTPRLDVFDPVIASDPYPVYARLRAEGALCRAGPATVAITRHSEATALLRDHRLGHGRPENMRPAMMVGGLGTADDVLGRVLSAARPDPYLAHLVSAQDPPEHTRVRRLLAKALGHGVWSRLEQVARSEFTGLLDVALDRGRADMVRDVALPLQTRVAGELLGVPETDRAEVARHAAELGRVIILIPFAGAAHDSGEREARWLRDYVSDLLRRRRTRPGGDLLSRLAAVRTGDTRLSDDEIVDNAVFLFFAGFETSVHLLAGGVAALLAFPGEFARLRADPGLAALAVEEFLRYDAPLQWVSRTTKDVVDVGPTRLKPGRFVLILLGSANRDERTFAAPDRLDIARHPNPHLSLGGGAHHCLGAVLARAQGTAVFGQLARRCAAIESAGGPRRRPHPNVRGYLELPVALRAA
jgi:cytochrome P450